MSETQHAPVVVAEYRSVRVAYWLWAAGFLLTIPVQVANLVGAGLEVEPSEVVVAIGMLVVAFVVAEHFRRGKPLARAALAGFAGYCAAGSATDLLGVSVVVGLDSLSTTLVIVGVLRAGVLVAALVLSYSRRVDAYFTFDEPARGVPAVRGALLCWSASVAAVAGQLLTGFVGSLPSGGDTWRDWLVLDAENTMAAVMGLALLPAWCCTVRQFWLGRQWARGTLTVVGVAIGTIEVVMFVDGAESTPVTVLAAVHLVTTVVALGLSYRRRGLLDREPVPAFAPTQA